MDEKKKQPLVIYKYKRPMIIKILPPIKVDIFPKILLSFFPKIKPKYVNVPAKRENIIALINGLSYIEFNPRPTEKLSKLTANPNINNSKKFIISTFRSFLKD